jgi:twitching motility protein PilT
MPRVDAFLKLAREQGASDVHFTAGRPPMVRMDGELSPIKYRDLAHDELELIIGEMLDENLRAAFGANGSVDFSYASPDAGRFRTNICRQSRGITAVCRVIPDSVMPLAQLGLPQVVSTIAKLTHGLVLVTGATGSGKSTTLAAVVDEINRTRSNMIVTLEDPIEFVHKSDKSLIVQREIGIHVASFSEGLRAALREDPDVILVGELRDLETIRLALEASETGHLVLGTLHTRGAAQTIDRILDSFPPEAHNQIRHTLAENLRCVLSQALVRNADGRGRRAVVEVLVVMPAIAQLIREGKTFQIHNAIETGKRHGMQLMDHALLSLVKAGDVDAIEAHNLALDKRPFQPYLTRAVPEGAGDRPAAPEA